MDQLLFLYLLNLYTRHIFLVPFVYFDSWILFWVRHCFAYNRFIAICIAFNKFSRIFYHFWQSWAIGINQFWTLILSRAQRTQGGHDTILIFGKNLTFELFSVLYSIFRFILIVLNVLKRLVITDITMSVLAIDPWLICLIRALLLSIICRSDLVGCYFPFIYRSKQTFRSIRNVGV